MTKTMDLTEKNSNVLHCSNHGFQAAQIHLKVKICFYSLEKKRKMAGIAKTTEKSAPNQTTGEMAADLFNGILIISGASVLYQPLNDIPLLCQLS